MIEAVSSATARSHASLHALQKHEMHHGHVHRQTVDEFRAHVEAERARVAQAAQTIETQQSAQVEGPASNSAVLQPGPAEAIPAADPVSDFGNVLDRLQSNWSEGHTRIENILADPNASLIDTTQATIGIQNSLFMMDMLVNSGGALTKEANSLLHAS